MLKCREQLNAIAEKAARTLWVHAWAEKWVYRIDHGEIDRELQPWSAGDELMNLAPETPSRFSDDASHLLATMEMDTGVNIASHLRAYDLEEDEGGHLIASSALGVGVGLWEHDDGALKIPYIEVFADTDELGI